MRKVLLGVTALLAVGCGGLAVGSSTSAEDIQPPTPVPPWCRECPEGIRSQIRVEATDPVSQVNQLVGADRTTVSKPILCETVWPNDLEQLTRFRTALAELYQVATGSTKAWCDEQLRLVDSKIAEVESNLATCR
jgi:hypothetical protein